MHADTSVTTHYCHKDHLGSIATITNEAGGPRLDFEASFGQYRQQTLHAVAMWTITFCHAPLQPNLQTETMTLLMMERIATAVADLDAWDSLQCARPSRSLRWVRRRRATQRLVGSRASDVGLRGKGPPTQNLRVLGGCEHFSAGGRRLAGPVSGAGCRAFCRRGRRRRCRARRRRRRRRGRHSRVRGPRAGRPG